MPLIDFRGLNKHYMETVKCKNCNTVGQLKIPKGETVEEFVGSDRALCEHCGCSTLEIKEIKKGVKKNDEKIPFS